MATVNIGSLRFDWKGAYNGSTAYVKDDVVSYNGSSYICILASTNNLPTNTTYFQPMATKGTDGTDVGTTITTQGDLLYRDGSGLQRLAAGTSGQLLQTGGSGANPSWTTFSSDYVKIAGGSTTASNYIDVQGCFSADYKLYKLLINFTFNGGSYIELGLLKASDNSVDAGTYYVRANGEYTDNSSGNGRWTAGANQNTYDQSDSNGFRLVNTWQNNYASELSMSEVTFDNPFASRKTMIQHTTTWSQSAHLGMSHGIGMLDTTNSHSGIRLGNSGSANFTTDGYYAVYGLKN